MPRTLPYAASELNANEQETWDFVKIEFPAPIGILRFTTRPGGFVGNIDGSSQTWVEYPFSYSPITQVANDLYSVNWISFPNLDNVWDNYNYDPGIRKIVTTIYEARWRVSDNSFLGARVQFKGRMDDGEFGEEAKINLKPLLDPNQLSPYSKIGGRCTNDFMNPLDCQYPYTPGLTCEKTRAACRAYGNEIHINIYDDLITAGEQIVYGGINHGLITKRD
jgi:hypothetical protein